MLLALNLALTPLLRFKSSLTFGSLGGRGLVLKCHLEEHGTHTLTDVLNPR